MWLWQSHLVPVNPSQTLWDRQPSQHFAQFSVILQQLGVPSLHVTLAGIIGTPQYTDCSNQLLPLSAVADAGYQSAHWTKRTRRSIPPARAALARKRNRQNQSARRTRTPTALKVRRCAAKGGGEGKRKGEGEGFFLGSALLKELAENSKEANKVRTTRTETSRQRQAPTHPALLACGIGSRQASSQTTLHTKWTTS